MHLTIFSRNSVAQCILTSNILFRHSSAFINFKIILVQFWNKYFSLFIRLGSQTTLEETFSQNFHETFISLMFKRAFQIFILKGNHWRQDVATFRWLNSYLTKHSWKFSEIVYWPTLFAWNRGGRNSECKRGVCTLGIKYHSIHKWPFSSFLLTLREKI